MKNNKNEKDYIFLDLAEMYRDAEAIVLYPCTLYVSCFIL